ncbi:hypothetical protein [Pseudonocardia acaciae]|uniref:hypothetical protein n=1 Tax=Pseudonocardia acaciae TaxID=551276 RepID=UPI000AADDF31|nr:hypothetical protein [Pseudonocardia acaciae]
MINVSRRHRTRDYGLPTLGDFGRFYLARWRGNRTLRRRREHPRPAAQAVMLKAVRPS